MEPWQEVVVATLGALVTIAGGLKWFLTWLFQRIETQQKAYLDALKRSEERVDRERDARLADKDAYASTLLTLARELQKDRIARSERPPRN